MSFQRSLHRLKLSPWYKVIEAYANDLNQTEPLEFNTKLRAHDREDVRQIGAYFNLSHKSYGQGTQKRITIIKRDYWEADRPHASERIKSEEEGALLCQKLEAEISGVDLVLLQMEKHKDNLYTENRLLSKQNQTKAKGLKRDIRVIELEETLGETDGKHKLKRLRKQYQKAKRSYTKLRKAPTYVLIYSRKTN